MPHVSGIGTWFAPGSAAAANNASDDIDTMLAPGSAYNGAANTGAAGQSIIDGAAGMQNVGADFGAMDHDTQMLGSLSTNYLQNYMGGGLLTAAQQAQSGANISGLNTSQLREGSEREAKAVNSVAQNENAVNAEGATNNRAQAAALQLKKAAMQMLISHTNNMTAIARQKLQQGVGNVGTNAALSLQGGAGDARSNQMSIYEGGRMAGAQAAMGIGTAIGAAGAAAGGTISSMMNSPVAAGVSGAGGAAGSAVSSGYSPSITSAMTGDGYALPSSALGSAMNTGVSKLATGDTTLGLANGSATYSPFATEAGVNTAYPLASAWGMNSLSNNTLPS